MENIIKKSIVYIHDIGVLYYINGKKCTKEEYEIIMNKRKIESDELWEL